VGVGEHDPPDPIATAAAQHIEMAVVEGARIDDHDLVDADQVGVQPGLTVVARTGDPANQRAEARATPGVMGGSCGSSIMVMKIS
jgi:hypothetical protein